MLSLKEGKKSKHVQVCCCVFREKGKNRKLVQLLLFLLKELKEQQTFACYVAVSFRKPRIAGPLLFPSA